MEQTNNGGEAAKRPQFLTVLCVLSYIGSGLWALVSLIGIFASGWIMSMLGGGAAESAMSEVDTSAMTSDQVAAMESM